MIYRCHILNTLYDSLFDLYISGKSPREMKSIGAKIHDKKKSYNWIFYFNYFKFTMIDNKSVLDQVIASNICKVPGTEN